MDKIELKLLSRPFGAYGGERDRVVIADQDVVQFRLKTEYGADSRLEMGSWKAIRWITPDVPEELAQATVPTGCL